jgi:hypothetical protein
VKAGVAVVVIFLILVGYGIGQFVPYQNSTKDIAHITNQLLGALSDISSLGTNSHSTTNSSCGNLSPVSVVSIFETYSNNAASGDAQYTGKTICVISASGAVTTNSNGAYVSYCPNGFEIETSSSGYQYIVNDFCHAIYPADVILVWQSQSIASQIPTDGSSFTAKCTVSGYDTTTHLFPILTFDGCVLLAQ